MLKFIIIVLFSLFGPLLPYIGNFFNAGEGGILWTLIIPLLKHVGLVSILTMIIWIIEGISNCWEDPGAKKSGIFSRIGIRKAFLVAWYIFIFGLVPPIIAEVIPQLKIPLVAISFIDDVDKFVRSLLITIGVIIGYAMISFLGLFIGKC